MIQKLTIGRIVHYRVGDVCGPAIIITVVNQSVTLFAFLCGEDDEGRIDNNNFLRLGVEQGLGNWHWHWPDDCRPEPRICTACGQELPR